MDIRLKERIDLFKEKLRPAYKPVAIVTGLELLSLCTLLRTGWLNRDDLDRAVKGYREWYLGNRYIDEYLSVILHAGRKIADIGPLPQLLALVIMAITSYLTIYVFAEGRKVGFGQMFAVLPRTLFPYFLPCLAYKFDSPYMAISILAGTIPLVYANEKTGLYFAVSFLGTLATCMSYQASLGVYPIMVLFVIYYFWKEAKWDNIKSLKTLGVSILAYFSGLIVYKVVFVRYVISYATGEVFALRELPMGVINRYKKIYSALISDCTRAWKLLIVVLLVCFVAYTIYSTKRSKVLSLVLGLLVLFVSSVLVIGPLIAFTDEKIMARYCYGMITPIVMIAVILSFEKGLKPGKIAAWVLSWCFLVFGLIYGNALTEQIHYMDTRCQLDANELNEMIDADEDTEYTFTGDCGYAPAIKELVERMPMLKKMQLPKLGLYFWGEYYFSTHYGDGISKFHSRKNVEVLGELEVVKNTKAFTIYRSGKTFVIEMKQNW